MKKRREQPTAKTKTASSPARLAAATAWVRAHSLLLFVILTAFATFRIVATYAVFNHTCDEPAHVACGMEWLEKGVYQFEPQHPPLARVATALGPYLAGCRLPGKSGFYFQGAEVLYSGKQYLRNLSLARLGILPFFWIAALVVYLWAKRDLGELEAVLAVFLFSFLPPVLAHAGVATTDMALAAMVGAAFFCGLLWLERPTPLYSALFGVCVGLAVLSKFSALAFLPAAIGAELLCYIAVERPGAGPIWAAARKRAPSFGLAVLVGALTIWAGYRFSFAAGVPAPELWAGIHDVMEHNAKGHTSYLLGSRSEHGWWYYYLVILTVKTPLAFLGLLILGAARCARRVWLPLGFSLGILLFSMSSGINIGVRHVLPLYIGFSLVAAAGAAWLWERADQARWAAAVLGLALVWMAATSLMSHPDYLPYFNALAGDEPEKIAVDSDLDWGQDINRLGQRLREVGAPEVTFNSFIVAKLEAMHGFPPVRPTQPQVPSPGWNAVSLTLLRVGRLGLLNSYPEVKLWPDEIKPTERIGKGMWLYYFPPRQP